MPNKPSARPAPNPNDPRVTHPYQPPSPYAPPPIAHSGSFGWSSPPQGYGFYHPPPPPQTANVYSSFPPGTHPDVILSFQMVDTNRNGYIEEKELQDALAWNYQRFSPRTLRLLNFLFRDPRESSSIIGPKEFEAIWRCLGQWRAIFERFDRDRSGKIDATELKDALLSLGYAVLPSVLQVLISRYDDGSRRPAELSFDSFIECGMIVKGLSEKFKEKDKHCTGSATLTYETFMYMIIPFLVAD
ncbi:probable calcium-binding protein CML48 isoform X2 [Salvia hispanica]|uniref:probable calcium-binding protein CML48 isoform X2 n=1 Tax=Salvia hispanica TaxID=49212 RepID=UPI0020099B98|nr:probable calcium-binding protein CML48 isoform X2 [Salvia hispanica]